jgi:glycosyltransferase involved in cell wall biosynthesis
MLRNLFSRKDATLPALHEKNIREFISYLVDRGISPTTISRFTQIPRKRGLTDHNTVFSDSKYFIIPDTGRVHEQLTGQLDSLGLRYFEGSRPVPFLVGGSDINYTGSRNTSGTNESHGTSSPGGFPKVVALMHVFNEGDMLGETIRHLIDQGVSVHIIDNWSTDESWEIAGSFPENQVSRERFPLEGPSEHYEWYKQLEYSEQLAATLPYDWFIHYDADELRYSPWKGVSLKNAIGFIDRLGYNAIDFTVLDFRYTQENDQVKAGYEKNITWFEFGKRPGHFLQVKAWKKQAVAIELKNSGGHNAQFPGRKLYPVKFLTKHYSLRSREQAERKLVLHRLPRVQKELSERNWHHHINTQIDQQAAGWDRKDLVEWIDDKFEKDFLLERISGVGIVKP